MVRLTAALNKLIAMVAVCSLQTVLLGASANIDDPLKGNLDDQSLQIHKPLSGKILRVLVLQVFISFRPPVIK